MENNVFSYTGSALTVSHMVTIGSAISWVIMFLKIIREITHKKYRQLLLLLLIGFVTAGITLLFPIYSFSTPAIAFVNAMIFFTMENPDAGLISKLNEAKSNAEDANKTKTDFLSSMSHEIRTPLNAIVGFGQALAKEDISGTAKEEVQDILMASNTLLEIVNGILDISKIESNKIEITNAEYSTKRLLDEITSLINARIGSKALDLKIIIDENLPPVLYGDAMRVKQVIINLLTNAVKYTKEGRILFQVKAENVMDICKLTISVQDTGIGMTEEAVSKIFSKFERFDMQENIQIEGTGLGMAITKSLIELMNGTIDVKSKYGQGSTFTISLDQKIVPKKSLDNEEENDSQAKVFNASSSKVLVVEDNKINLKVAKRLLSDYKIQVETANSGSECIDAILDDKKYDLIFMDIMMPKMNGIETLENLKNIVGFDMPVVALTADVISGMEDKYISQGFDDCLAKPIVEEELYYMLKKYLKESK
jgi:signal transduction histidine kinase/CheY-like chemotaxis protein